MLSITPKIRSSEARTKRASHARAKRGKEKRQTLELAPWPLVLPPRSFTTTLAPREARNSAYARPRPAPAPVTTATWPSNRSSDMLAGSGSKKADNGYAMHSCLEIEYDCVNVKDGAINTSCTMQSVQDAQCNTSKIKQWQYRPNKDRQSAIQQLQQKRSPWKLRRALCRPGSRLGYCRCRYSNIPDAVLPLTRLDLFRGVTEKIRIVICVGWGLSSPLRRRG